MREWLMRWVLRTSLVGAIGANLAVRLFLFYLVVQDFGVMRKGILCSLVGLVMMREKQVGIPSGVVCQGFVSGDNCSEYMVDGITASVEDRGG